MKWMFRPLRLYADFDGRSPRREFWLFMLLIVVVVCGLIGLGVGLSGNSGDGGDVNPLIGLPLVLAALFFLAALIPFIAAMVRRLHDRDMSGWFVVIMLVPWVGWLIMAVLMILPGNDGENSHGENPLIEESQRPEVLEGIFN